MEGAELRCLRLEWIVPPVMEKHPHTLQLSRAMLKWSDKELPDAGLDYDKASTPTGATQLRIAGEKGYV